jgi:hypothetical protein
LTLEKYAINGIDNWHLNSLSRSQLARTLRGDDSLRHRFPVLENVVQLPSLPQLDPDCPVST